jgi:hypothetical protein
MKFVPTCCVLAVLLSLIGSPSVLRAKDGEASGKLLLRYKFASGEVIRSEIVQRGTMETTIQGTTQTAEMRSASVKLWNVREADDEKATFLHQIESIDMWQRTKGRPEVRYNSQTDTEVPPAYEEAAKAVGVPLTVITVDTRGRVIKREERFPQQNNDSQPLVLILPETEVAVGDTWTNPMDLKVLLQDSRTIKTVQARQHCKLDKLQNGVATISIDSQVLTPVHDAQIEVQLVQRLPKGTVDFDVEAGRVRSMQLDVDQRVLGFSGAASSMHCLSRLTEKLLPAGTPETALKPASSQEPIKSSSLPSAKRTGGPIIRR